MAVAVAEPAMPILGAGPRPRMKTGLRPLSSRTETIMNHSGVMLSPDPRSAIINSAIRIMVGMAMKITRRYASASGAASAGVPSTARIAGDRNQPATAIRMVAKPKAPAAVPKMRRAPSTSFRPQYWPIRMVEAMPKPNTNAFSRNITILALDVAASACSPRKRPTQMALIVPFNDWMIDEASVGRAKLSRVAPILPCVRSPRPPPLVPASAIDPPSALRRQEHNIIRAAPTQHEAVRLHRPWLHGRRGPFQPLQAWPAR